MATPLHQTSMKHVKIITSILILLMLGLATASPYLSHADSVATFALVASDPDRAMARCVALPQASLLAALQANSFNPLQDSSGFIYSLIGYAGPQSSDPASQQAFWSLWQLNGSRYQFSQVGPTEIQPQAGMVYAFQFGNGQTPPPVLTYDQVCHPSTPTPLPSTPKPTVSSIPVIAAAPTATTQPAASPDLTTALQYLRSHYATQSVDYQDWAAIALGLNGQAIAPPDVSPTDVLSLARHALALETQHRDARSVVTRLEDQYHDGQIGPTHLINAEIFSVLAIAGQDPSWLASHSQVFADIGRSQRSDGSFGFAATGASDADTTAAAIWALRLGGASSQATIAKAFDYLMRAQNSDGGLGYMPGQPSNIDTSAWTAIAFTSTGRSNAKLLSYITAGEQGDGAWRYDNRVSYLASAYAVMALARQPLPTAAVPQVTSTPASQSSPGTNSTISPMPPSEASQSTVAIIKKPTPVSSTGLRAHSSATAAAVACRASAVATAVATGGAASASAMASSGCD